jgi:type I restriction-modification system DNA methylase subunit
VKSTNAYKNLFTLFQAADNRYNSGLFYFRKGDKAHVSESELDTITPKLKLDDKILKEIIGGLYYPSPYLFDVIPADILGQVYEQFLGKVIRMTAGGMVKIEEKPEVRKAGGVYYTPTYIVDYIVKNTVGKMLDEEKKAKPSLKILDPACGSGSFLLGAYSYMLHFYLGKYSEDAKKLLAGKNAPIYEVGQGIYALTTPERKRILLEHIYGVDIDEQAVEVAKLNLMLKCLEGEAGTNLKLSVERILPDLAGNIKCGNSLIGHDFNDGLFAEFEQKKINPFDWNSEFADIMKQGGFDVVIGNPPYIRMEEFKELKEYFRKKYNSHDERTDMYVYFIEKSVNLLKLDGSFGYIVANRWIRSNYGNKLREFLLKSVILESIIDFGELRVFTNAATMPVIVIFKKVESNRVYDFNYVPPVEKSIFTQVSAHNLSVADLEKAFAIQIKSSKLSGSQWKLTSEGNEAILERIAENSITLYEYVDGKIRYGIKTGLVKAFVIDDITRKKILSESPKSSTYIKPYIVGDDVRKYRIRDQKRYLIYPDKGIKISEHKGILNHLEPLREKLERRATKQEWYELQQPQFAYRTDYEAPKIVYPDIAKESRFAFDAAGRYPADTTFIIPSTDLFLLGLLNSKLAWFYFSLVCPVLGDAKRGGRLRLKYNYVRGFPVNVSDKKIVESIRDKVDRLLTLNKDMPQGKTPQEKIQTERQIAATDREIDKLVYELYGLSEEEIRVVEGREQ